jgi:two-component system, OmpR family, response regulator
MLKSLLIIEDDEGIREYLKTVFTENNYMVRAAATGAAGLETAEKYNPDLIILDLGLPDVSGESICTTIRKHHPSLPIIILTARDSTGDIVRGLNIGANDYVTKPFEIEELLARVRARLREQGNGQSKLKIADLELDSETMEVRRDSKLINLSPHEFKLLEFLMSSPGRVLSRDTILNRIWLYSPDIETRVVDVYIGYLRKKIDAAASKKLIHSVRGFGYVIKE